MLSSRPLPLLLLAITLGAGESTPVRPAAAAEVGTNPSAVPVRPSTAAAITAEELLGHIQYLASEALQGREAGTPGGLLAAEYLAQEYHRFGLAPAGAMVDGRAVFFQTIQVSRVTGVAEGARLTVSQPEGASWVGESGQDFVPLNLVGGRPMASGPVAFAGYAIHAPDLGYDDFAGLDLQGRWALVLRYEPQEKDPRSVFDGQRHSVHAGLLRKVTNCLQRGAVGVLIVTGPLHREDKPDILPKPEGEISETVPRPAGFISRRAASKLLASAHLDLLTLQKDIDADLRPRSAQLPGISLEGGGGVTTTPTITMRNVLASLPGRDPALSAEAVLIGAHYDHIGMGQFDSAAGPAGRGRLHPGADDNASGTAAVLEVAQWMAALPSDQRPRRTVIFASFDAEEKGLIGSAFAAARPLVPERQLIGMINLDMFGHLKGVDISGVVTARGLKDLVQKALAPMPGFPASLAPFPGAGSDHISFYDQRIPVLFLAETYLPPVYHRPEDVWQTIDAPAAAQAAEAAGRLIRAWADVPERLPFFKPQQQAYLGVRPDPKHLAAKDGYHLGQVEADGPAARAGLKAGDVILSLSNRKVTSLLDLIDCLGNSAPGDQVRCTIRRQAETLEVTITLGTRPGGSDHG